MKRPPTNFEFTWISLGTTLKRRLLSKINKIISIRADFKEISKNLRVFVGHFEGDLPGLALAAFQLVQVERGIDRYT